MNSEAKAMLTQTAIPTRTIRAIPSIRIAAQARRVFGVAAEAQSVSQTMQLMGATMSYPRNTEIFGEDEPADYVYQVMSGSVRTYKVLSDGRRQIGAFYLPGDIFGLQFEDECPLSAEAMIDTTVLVVKRSAFNALASHNTSIAQEILALTSHELWRMQKRILLLIKSAQERVASFLLEMAERAPASNAIELPMSRQDIADYLGLTIETVSRTLTSLEAAATIELPTSRRVVLRNRNALMRLTGCLRKSVFLRDLKAKGDNHASP
jgi:CRP/FNR family transcriptional regulator, nitrogen fixation regulation protein